LENGFDGILRETLLGSPDIVPILRDRFAGVEAERLPRPPEQEKYRAGEVKRCATARLENASGSAA
jgi:hypothetical protein